jgi:hypothetical protein
MMDPENFRRLLNEHGLMQTLYARQCELDFRRRRTMFRATLILLIGLAIGLTGAISALAVTSTWYEESNRPDELRQKVSAIQMVVSARRQAVEELLDGKASLPETAGRFRVLRAVEPIDIMRALDRLFPGHSEDELDYKHVFLYVETACKNRTDGNERLNSLREEFEGCRQTGTLHTTARECRRSNPEPEPGHHAP